MTGITDVTHRTLRRVVPKSYTRFLCLAFTTNSPASEKYDRIALSTSCNNICFINDCRFPPVTIIILPLAALDADTNITPQWQTRPGPGCSAPKPIKAYYNIPIAEFNDSSQEIVQDDTTCIPFLRLAFELWHSIVGPTYPSQKFLEFLSPASQTGRKVTSPTKAFSKVAGIRPRARYTQACCELCA